MALAGWGVPGVAPDLSCTCATAPLAVVETTLQIRGIDPATLRLRVVPGHEYLVEVGERNKDALVEVLDSKNQLIARADHPERRTGTRRIMVRTVAAAITVRVRGKESGGSTGRAIVRLFDLTVPGEARGCRAALTALAKADGDYAAAEDISGGHSSLSAGSARAAFQRAGAEYAAAERELTSPVERRLQGEAALAVAGLEYVDLQDWTGAANWAQTAAVLLKSADPYRWARAQGLLAASWIEIVRKPAPRSATPEETDRPAELLVRAQGLLQQLEKFHQGRGETYDVALQLTYIAVTYTYEGRFRECLAPAKNAIDAFGAIGEKIRRAQALQNQAMCLWGLGQLPEALLGFERALEDIGPEPYPTIYVLAITNTALVHFALGHFDESLRLYDRALKFTKSIQSPRSEAFCLYGIGVNYYALGDPYRAREFLERSLAIRTVAVDRRGRLATLRALAPVYADLKQVDKALKTDQEALDLAVAPSTIARLEIQRAVHTASAGHLAEAKSQLDEVIQLATSDPTIKPEALLQRAALLRQMHLPQQALSDLKAARPGLHALGNVTKEFEADLELARTLRATRQPDAALQAVNQALEYADAVRLQSVNPELRAELQTPLRPAHDLKLQLLWEKYERAVAEARDGDANALAAAAFSTADAARAQTFADIAAQRYPPALREALAHDFDSRKVLYRELATRRNTLETLLDSPGGAHDRRTPQLIIEIGDLEREVDTINTRIASRAGAAEVPTERRLRNIPSLRADTALVSYWLGADTTYAWVLQPQGIHWLRLGSSAKITGHATAFHESMTHSVDRGVADRLRDSRTLYRSILEPVEPWLAEFKRWVIVPDGALDYVPFAALQAADGSFVVMQHDIALTPAAWTLDATPGQQRSRAPRRLLLAADPVYQANDPRMAAVKPRSRTPEPQAEIPDDPTRRPYRRLPYTGEEARHIAAQFPHSDVDQLIGLDATRERLLALDWSSYRFIHIATHGVVDAQVPQLSALILGSYDARGEVADNAVRVVDLSLETLNADVVVLSACETALGKEVRSEGLVGLGSTMLARGARAVVASLWPVSDEMGEQLMTDFYRHLLPDSLSPEKALGDAMRAVLSRDRSKDPALWAAFQVSVAEPGPPLPSVDVKTARVTLTTPP